MVKAVLTSYMGTLVQSDRVVIDLICNEIQKTGNCNNHAEIYNYWEREFSEKCYSSYKNTYKKQKRIAQVILNKMVKNFESTADPKELFDILFKYRTTPAIFEDTKDFIKECPVPVCIVTNSDMLDLNMALRCLDINPKLGITSESAKAYKPRTDILTYALNKLKLTCEDVIFIGATHHSGIEQARELGIKTIWLNRSNKETPAETDYSFNNLTEILESDLFK